MVALARDRRDHSLRRAATSAPRTKPRRPLPQVPIAYVTTRSDWRRSMDANGAAVATDDGRGAVDAAVHFKINAVPQRADPIAAERQRREYESLFASNVVVSRRAPPRRRRAIGTATAERWDWRAGRRAIARCHRRSGGSSDWSVLISRGPRRPNVRPQAARSRPCHHSVAPEAHLPDHTVPEGTIIDAVLTNRSRRRRFVAGQLPGNECRLFRR